jgi:hypothetical protein
VPSVAGYQEFQDLVRDSSSGAKQEEQLMELERCPTSFTFDFGHDSDPGKRRWVRDGNVWTETQPSGIQNVSVISGFLTVNGVKGCEIKRINGESVTVFIPDRDVSGPKELLFKGQQNEWISIGSMDDIR